MKKKKLSNKLLKITEDLDNKGKKKAKYVNTPQPKDRKINNK